MRELLANVPIRIVATKHDTSVAMIEKTYSKFIGDFADALAARRCSISPSRSPATWFLAEDRNDRPADIPGAGRALEERSEERKRRHRVEPKRRRGRAPEVAEALDAMFDATGNKVYADAFHAMRDDGFIEIEVGDDGNSSIKNASRSWKYRPLHERNAKATYISSMDALVGRASSAGMRRQPWPSPISSPVRPLKRWLLGSKPPIGIFSAIASRSA